MTQTQADFTKACRVAAERLWMHRNALHRVAVRIGFWPDGLVISAAITARTNAEMVASSPPRTIPWDQVETITEIALVAIVDELCNPLYDALGVPRAS